MFVNAYDKTHGEDYVFELNYKSGGTLTPVVAVPGIVQSNICTMSAKGTLFLTTTDSSFTTNNLIAVDTVGKGASAFT